MSYNAQGTTLWVRQLGGASNDLPAGVAVDTANNVVVVGYTQGDIDLGGGMLPRVAGFDGFAAKYSPTGNYVWGKVLGGSNTDWSAGVAADAAGNTVLTGQFAASIDFGGGALFSAGGYDTYLVSLGP
jgi:hypothetical protein